MSALSEKDRTCYEILWKNQSKYENNGSDFSSAPIITSLHTDQAEPLRSLQNKGYIRIFSQNHVGGNGMLVKVQILKEIPSLKDKKIIKNLSKSTKKPWHSSDYNEVKWKTHTFNFTSRQALVIKTCWENQKTGNSNTSKDEIIQALIDRGINSENQRKTLSVPNVFKSSGNKTNSAYNNFLKKVKGPKALYYLKDITF